MYLKWAVASQVKQKYCSPSVRTHGEGLWRGGLCVFILFWFGLFCFNLSYVFVCMFVCNGFPAKLSVLEGTGQCYLYGRCPGVDAHIHSCDFWNGLVGLGWMRKSGKNLPSTSYLLVVLFSSCCWIALGSDRIWEGVWRKFMFGLFVCFPSWEALHFEVLKHRKLLGLWVDFSNCEQ